MISITLFDGETGTSEQPALTSIQQIQVQDLPPGAWSAGWMRRSSRLRR